MAATKARKGRVYGGKDPKERLQERQRKLLDAALELFGTKGYGATTVKEICAEAGLTERYFYESYGNREELFVEVAGECAGGLVVALTDARRKAGEDVDAQLLAMVETYFRWFEDDPRRVRIQLFEPFLVSERTQALYRDVTAVFVAMVGESAIHAFDDAIARDELDADLLAWAMVGAAVEMVKEWALSDYARSREEMVKNTTFLFSSLTERFRREDPLTE